MLFKTTALYAAVLGLVYVVLSMRVSAMRVRKKIPLGDGGDKDMLRAIRVQQNFNEYTPIFLILLAAYEFIAGPFAYINAFGLAFVFARALHIYGFGFAESYSKDMKKGKHVCYRSASAIITYVILFALSFIVIWEKILRCF